MPRQLEDLPYADRLEPLVDGLEQEGDYSYRQLRNIEYDDVDVRGSRFTESAFSSVTFVGGNLADAHFNTVLLRRVDLMGTSLSQTSWLDGDVIDSAWAGVEAIGAGLRRVTFEGCKFDGVNFRAARLRDVTFRDCVLRDTDFGAAQLTSVSFPGSRLDGLALTRATLKAVDLRGAERLSLTDGLDALRGAIVTTGQLMELAPLFAARIGLRVDDR